MFKVWTKDKEAWTVRTYNDAIDACWRECYHKIEELRAEEVLTDKQARFEVRKLNQWFKELKQEPSKADNFMIDNEIYAYLMEVE